MKRAKNYKAISIVMIVIMLLAIICAITANGSGFLNMSNVVRYFAIGAAAICGIIAIITWILSKKGV